MRHRFRAKRLLVLKYRTKENHAVMLREILQSQEFQSAKSRLSFAVGKDIAGKPVVTDIAKMPHLLIAGATGSGKSVCINTLIVSILYKASPEDVKLIMIDPKVVELSVITVFHICSFRLSRIRKKLPVH